MLTSRAAVDVVYFILLVGVLIFVHELGHFAWAKFFGVKVLKFSLGFGPKLVGFRRGDTEYVVAALPIGGYVRMLGENPTDVIEPADAQRAFHTQPFWKRVIIVIAGPMMNLLFPIALYFVVALGDTRLPPAIIGTVFPDRPAHGKLMPGDRVVAIDGDEIETFYELNRIVEDSAGQPLRFTVERGEQRVDATITPALVVEEGPLETQEEVGRIGVKPHHPLAVIGVTSPASPAGAARLRTFDRIVAANGRPIDRWIDLDDSLASNRGQLVPLTYLRPVRLDRALGGLVEMDVYEPHVATLTPEPGPGSGLDRAGIESADLYVAQVIYGSAEHHLGLRPGDRLVSLDGEPIRLWAQFIEDLRVGGGRAHTLVWRRGDRELNGRLRLRHERGVNEYGQVYDRYVVGVRNWVPARVQPGVENPSPIGYAIEEAVRSTWEMVELTAMSVVRLFQGRLTVKSLAGPLTVFEVAGTAAREGAPNFLTFMAFISINLGLINLLPIPLLDGGHLLFFLIEAIARRPVSVRVRQYAAIGGLFVLIVLMVLAFKNDIERQWPRIVDTIGEE